MQHIHFYQLVLFYNSCSNKLSIKQKTFKFMCDTLFAMSNFFCSHQGLLTFLTHGSFVKNIWWTTKTSLFLFLKKPK